MNCQITGTARLFADPELRFTPAGKAVTELRLMVSNSTKRRDGSGYDYSPTIWVSATLWEQMATNAAEVLRGGDELVFAGQLEKEEYEKRDGSKGDKLVLKFAEVAPSIRRGPVVTRPAQRSDNRAPAAAGAQARPQAVDPWGSDEPPF